MIIYLHLLYINNNNMPRKCAPGVFCIENFTLFVLVAIFITFGDYLL